MSRHECPLCGSARPTRRLLLVHVAECHLQYVLHDTDEDGRFELYRCWCGKTFWVGPGRVSLATDTSLGEHLDKAGGIQEHFLACALGVADAEA